MSLPFSFHAEIVEVEIGGLPSIVSSGNFTELNRTVWCSRPTTGVPRAPCHDEFRGPRSDYVRQQELKKHSDDSYFCSCLMPRYNLKNQKLISCPDNKSSAIHFVPHGNNIPVPLPPTKLQKIPRYIRSQVDQGNLCWSRYWQAYEG
ncbi:hypothetical protein TNCV_3273931 [Trichonephila clavipes]|nr:hypothetical protein TNCV_3273931 [Trichonephila clavipes]